MQNQSPKQSVRIAISIAAIFVFLILVFRSSLAVAAGEGEAVYKAKCQMCHGPDGAGDTPTGKNLKVRDLRSPEVQKVSDAEMSDVITKGKNKMPAIGKALKPEEVTALVAHIRSFKK